MQIFEYKTRQERDRIISEQTASGLRLSEDMLRSPVTGNLYFLEADEIAAADAELARSELAASDVGLARGLEDLIDILEADNMNIRARLPQDLQDKLARRAALRGLISG